MRTLTTLTIRSAFTLCIVVAAAACSNDSGTAPAATVPATTPLAASSSPLTAVVTRAHALVPILGTCKLTVLATTPYPAPPVFKQVASGTCELSQLGRTTVNFVQVVDFGTGSQHSLELTYTAANGDVLRAMSSGTSAPITRGVRFSAAIDFVGGTGRFASASGRARAAGTADLAAGTSQYLLAGLISFDSGHARAW